jgi:hypothetical protein
MYFFFLGRNGPNVTTSVASLVARTKGYKTQNKTKQKQNKSKTKQNKRRFIIIIAIKHLFEL